MLCRLLTFSYMIGFFIKKAFFDGWDNLIGMVLFNIGYMFLAFVSIYIIMAALSMHLMIGFVVLAVVLLLFSIIAGGTAEVVHNYSDYKHDAWSAFKSGLKRNIRHSLLLFAVVLFFVITLYPVIPFWFSQIGGIAGGIAGIVLVWIDVAIVLALPYYFPLMNLLPADRPLKTLKKCLIVLADNMAFSLFFLLYSVICIAITVFTLGLIPGVVGLQLAGQDAMKLRMFKYDYLETENADRKHIPWEDLLYDEREKVGPRSLKSMIFPWKY